MKLHYTSSLLIIIISALPILAQPAIEWQRNYGGSLTDFGYSIALTDSGDYFFAGLSYSNDTDVTGHHGTSAEPDVWIVKTDPAGTILWQNSFGGTKSEYAKCIQATADGGCIFSAICYSNNDDVTDHHGSTAKTDIWVVKLNAEGSIEWKRSLGGSNLESCGDILITDDGYMICGSTNSHDGDITFLHTTNYDAWIVQLDNDGNILWQKCYGGNNIEFGNKISKTADGNYIVAGTSASSDGDVASNHGLNDVWIFEIDPEGNLLWEKSYGGASDDWGIDVLQSGDDFIIAGDVRSAAGDITDNHGEDDFWIAKIDASGNFIWQKCFGGSGNDIVVGLILSDDNILAMGETNSVDGDISGNHGNADYWLIQVKDDGSLDWQACYGGTNEDYGFAISAAEENAYLLTGYTLSVDGEILDPLGSVDMGVFKINNCSGDIPEIISAGDIYSVCEGSDLTIHLEATGDITGYTWIKDGVAEAASDADLLLTGLDTDDAGTYICNVIYACGYISSEPFTVVVNANPAAAITPLGDLNICETGSVELTATAGADYNYQWYFDIIDIAGATESNYTALTAGLYSVIITDSNSCSAQSEKITVIDSCGDAVTEIYSELNIMAENPVHDILHLQIHNETAAREFMISVFNNSGVLIFNTKETAVAGENTFALDLENISSGVYLLKIENAEMSAVKKIVKQ